jgi:hypothetical protein
MHIHDNLEQLELITSLPGEQLVAPSSLNINGLVMRWAFTAANAVDSIAGVIGSWQGTEGWATDMYSRCIYPFLRGWLTFTPVGLAGGAAPISMCCWNRVGDGTSSRALYCGGIADTSFLSLGTEIYPVAYSGSSSYLLGNRRACYHGWHHLACTYDGSTLSLYYDGYACGSAAIGLNLATTYGVLSGRRDSGGGSFYGSSNVADGRFYNRCLSSAEVTAIARRQS